MGSKTNAGLKACGSEGGARFGERTMFVFRAVHRLRLVHKRSSGIHGLAASSSSTTQHSCLNFELESTSDCKKVFVDR